MFRKKKIDKMNLKKSKKKRRLKLKYFLYLLIIYVSFAYTFYSSMQNNKKINNSEFINYLVNGGSIDKLDEINLVNVVNKTMNLFLNIDFSKPITLLNTSILGQKKEVLSTINLVGEDDYSNLEELKKISEYIEDPNPVDINNPIVLIYNTHQLENYDSKNLDIYGITPNVMMASYLLKEKLNKMGISTVVEDTNISDFLNLNGWDYSSSYKASRLLILDKISKYPSLKYFIDLHRDSVGRDLTVVDINGKKYAKILFVIGLEHDNYNSNLELATNINNLFISNYPNISRGILKKEGPYVDGIYNQDISSNSMLIELGGVENNIEEVLNTVEAISVVLKKYIEDDKSE